MRLSPQASSISVNVRNVTVMSLAGVNPGSRSDDPFGNSTSRLSSSLLRKSLKTSATTVQEPVVADERRMDIVITYQNKRYIIELKRWYGEKYRQAGLQQLNDYLDIYSLKKGYLLIYDFNKGKSYKEEVIQFQDKSIFAVWV